MQTLFQLISRFEPPALVIGGHALAAHGVARQTADVDCLLAVENREAFDRHLRDAGFRRVAEAENFARYTHPSAEIADVDILLVDAPTFEKLRVESVSTQQGEAQLWVPALPHLIALKLHAIRNNPRREVGDLGDISRLLAANPGRISGEKWADLCRQFAPAGMEAKLKALQLTP